MVRDVEKKIIAQHDGAMVGDASENIGASLRTAGASATTDWAQMVASWWGEIAAYNYGADGAACTRTSATASVEHFAQARVWTCARTCVQT